MVRHDPISRMTESRFRVFPVIGPDGSPSGSFTTMRTTLLRCRMPATARTRRRPAVTPDHGRRRCSPTAHTGHPMATLTRPSCVV